MQGVFPFLRIFMPDEVKVITPPTDENGQINVDDNIEKLADWMKDKVRTKNKKGKFDVDIMLQNMVENIGVLIKWLIGPDQAADR